MMDLLWSIIMDWLYVVLMAGSGAMIASRETSVTTPTFKATFAVLLWMCLFLVFLHDGKVT